MVNKKIVHKSDIRLILASHYLGSKSRKAHESSEWFKDFQADFSVYLSPSGGPVLKLDPMTYLVFNPAFECWAVAPDDILMKSFDFDDSRVVDGSKPIKRDMNFEHQMEGYLTSLVMKESQSSGPELHDFLATKEEAGPISNAISRIEEEMLFCIENRDKHKYNECLKNYILELANHKQFEKLKYFLIVTLLSENPGKEREFLHQIGVRPDVIVNNSLKILEKIDYCRSIVEELKQAIAMSTSMTAFM